MAKTKKYLCEPKSQSSQVTSSQFDSERHVPLVLKSPCFKARATQESLETQSPWTVKILQNFLQQAANSTVSTSINPRGGQSYIEW